MKSYYWGTTGLPVRQLVCPSIDDHECREMLTTVFADSAGKELNVTFKATLNMEMSAFEKLAKNKLKGVYWITDEPHRESSEEYQKMHQKRQEEWLEKKLDLEEKIKAAIVRRLYDVTIVKDEKRYNCEQIVYKLCEGMHWVKREDAPEYAWRVRELREATVLTTSDPGIAGLIKNSLLSKKLVIRSSGGRIEKA